MHCYKMLSEAKAKAKAKANFGMKKFDIAKSQLSARIS